MLQYYMTDSVSSCLIDEWFTFFKLSLKISLADDSINYVFESVRKCQIQCICSATIGHGFS